MTVLTPPGYVQGGTYTAKLDRIYLATLGNIPNLAAAFSARQGFFGGRVPVYANPSGMNITLGACAGIIANTFASASGDYLFANDATVQVTPAASSPTQNRYDIIGFQVKDNLFDSSGLNTAVPAVIQGSNSAGTPSDPSLPASFIPVLRAVINAGVTSPTLIPLIRKTSADGGLLRIAGITERAEITPYEGMQVYREDRDWVEVHDGTAWRVADLAICTSVADRDSASGVSNPRSGQLAMTTDTDTLWQYDGATAAWVAIAGWTYPRGHIGEHKPGAPVTTGAATETVVCQFVTPILQANRRIKAEWQGDMSTNTADPGVQVIIRLRWKAGTTVDTSGTQFAVRDLKAGSGTNVPADIFGTFTTPSAGQFTVVATATPISGTATQAQNATEHQPHLLVADNGGA